MEGVEPQPAAEQCLEGFSKFPLWIIEYVWAHQMIDIQEGWFIILLYPVNLSITCISIRLNY